MSFYLGIDIRDSAVLLYTHYKPLQKNNDMDIYEADYVSNKKLQKQPVVLT
jgi:hypothetical protein